jgi:outer membrane receptor protein involved in Fe transport
MKRLVLARGEKLIQGWGKMFRPGEIKAISIVTGVVLAGGLFSGSIANAQGEGASAVEEIIVTAQKRSQSLADIPMSVSVLSSELLERTQADNFQDLVALVPGLSITSSQRGVTRVTLRGINTGGVASTVGVYFDEVPFGSSTGLANAATVSGDFDTFDVNRIEVLRGPQGTLYGASSLGGVMKYVPNQPNTEEFEARFQASAEDVKDGDMGYSFTGVVNIPASDSFALRASGFYRSDEGFSDSIGNNPIPTLTDPNVNVIEGTRVEDDLNSLDTYGGRVAALFQASDTFSVNLSAVLQNIESGGPDLVDADPSTLSPLNSSPVQSRYQRAFSDIEYRVYSANLDWDFGAASLQSITSDGSFEQNFQQDAAIASSLAGVPLSSFLTFVFDDPTTPEIAPLLSAILPQTTSTDKLTQEFRLVSKESDTFEWLVGAYYTDEESLISQTIDAVAAGTEDVVEGLGGLAIASIESTYEEIAVFANGTWHVTPDFELSFGARASSNDQSARQVTSGPLAGESDFTVDSSEEPVTWSVSPRFQLNDESSVYMRIATGFRPGGPNVVNPAAPPTTPRSYDSDSLTSYEVGYKRTSSDGRYAVDAAAYFLDWKDIQLLANVDGFGVNTNGGSAESTGLEFTMSYIPTDGLTLSLNGAYTDAELTEDTDPIVGGADGDPLPFVPEWSYGLSADYEWAVMGDSTAYVGGNLGYTGERPAALGNLDPDGNVREIPSNTILNLRAGLLTGRWSVEVYGKNVTDELGINAVGSVDEAVTGRVELGVVRPRTYGVKVGFAF